MEPLILSSSPSIPAHYLLTTPYSLPSQLSSLVPDHQDVLHFPSSLQSRNSLHPTATFPGDDRSFLDLIKRLRALKRAAIQNARDIHDLEVIVQQTASALRWPQSIESVIGEDDKERLVLRRRRQTWIRLGLPVAGTGRKEMRKEGPRMTGVISTEPPPYREKPDRI